MKQTNINKTDFLLEILITPPFLRSKREESEKEEKHVALVASLMRVNV